MRCIFAALLFLSSITTSFAEETNYLLPDAQVAWSAPLNNWSGFGMLGEAGRRNFRLSGTYGAFLTPRQRIKGTLEGLAQDLQFTQMTGRNWIFQGAAGLAYEFFINNCVFRTLNAGGAYSHAFGRGFGTNSFGRAQRVSNSDGVFLYVGSTLALGPTTLFTPSLEFENVEYHRRLNHDRTVCGVGASFELVQRLTPNCSLTLDTDFTPAYNAYGALLGWGFVGPFGCPVNSGLYANYVDGQRGLPNVLTGGVQLNFSFGRRSRSSCSPCSPCVKTRCPNIAPWLQAPAVYIPMVLAIADPGCNCPICIPIAVIANPQTEIGASTGSFFSYDISTNYTGSPITFTPQTVAPGVTLDANGIVSGLGPAPGQYFFTISPMNSCSVAPPLRYVIDSSG